MSKKILIGETLNPLFSNEQEPWRALLGGLGVSSLGENNMPTFACSCQGTTPILPAEQIVKKILDFTEPLVAREHLRELMDFYLLNNDDYYLHKEVYDTFWVLYEALGNMERLAASQGKEVAA